MAYEGDVFDPNEDEDRAEPRSAKRLLNAISKAQKVLDQWQTKADRIDKLYANLSSWGAYSQSGGFNDKEFNLFWASMEVIKLSIYSRPPVPVVTPVFKDRRPVIRTGAEMLERCAVRNFEISDINEVMLGIRDDLALNSRGVMWITYESGEDAGPYKELACPEHLDRKDFLHAPAKKWADVAWVARRAWLTPKEMKKRFKPVSGDLYMNANYGRHEDERGEGDDLEIGKAGVWEIWHKEDKRVYWVSEGCNEYLDDGEPHLKLRKFFPCPKPAYGTLEPRSLVPVPHITYIEDQLESINELTSKIRGLLAQLVVRGLIPAGTDVADAIEKAYREASADHMMIPVPAAQFSSQAKFVEWLPIDMVAQAILSAVEARRELIGNVQELFGIADIMRGETEAQETLGTQRLKAQYGSVRIRDMISELVRIAKDAVQIMSEIQAEEFSFDTLLEMSRMEIPKKSEIEKKIRDIKKIAEQELNALGKQAEQAAQNPEMQQNPEAKAQMVQQFEQATQTALAKYQPQLDELGSSVTQEDLRELLKDQKTGFADFDIQTDSTIYPDEEAAKANAAGLLTSLSGAATGLAPIAMMGKEGKKLVGDLSKMAIAPYRPGREIDGSIDEWVEATINAPEDSGNEESEGLVEAQKLLAQAEQEKARAAVMNVEAKAAKDQAENQRKMMELQQRGEESSRKAQIELATTQAKLEQAQAQVLKTQADIEHVNAQIAAIFAKINVDAKTVDLTEYRTVNDVQAKANQEVRADMQLQNQAQESEFEREQRLRGEDRQDVQVNQGTPDGL